MINHSVDDPLASLKAGLYQIRQPGTDGWPKPDGCYVKLMDAECNAGSLEVVDLTMTGQLRDLGYIAALYSHLPPQRLEHALAIVEARQNVVDARVQAGELTPKLIIPTTAFDECAEKAPDRVPYMARQVIGAVEMGWKISMIPQKQIKRHVLGQNIVSCLVFGNMPTEPTAAVYYEYAAGEEPHESWFTDVETVREHKDIYKRLARFAISHNNMMVGLEALAKGRR